MLYLQKMQRPLVYTIIYPKILPYLHYQSKMNVILQFILYHYYLIMYMDYLFLNKVNLSLIIFLFFLCFIQLNNLHHHHMNYDQANIIQVHNSMVIILLSLFHLIHLIIFMILQQQQQKMSNNFHINLDFLQVLLYLLLPSFFLIYQKHKDYRIMNLMGKDYQQVMVQVQVMVQNMHLLHFIQNLKYFSI